MFGLCFCNRVCEDVDSVLDLAEGLAHLVCHHCGLVEVSACKAEGEGVVKNTCALHVQVQRFLFFSLLLIVDGTVNDLVCCSVQLLLLSQRSSSHRRHLPTVPNTTNTTNTKPNTRWMCATTMNVRSRLGRQDQVGHGDLGDFEHKMMTWLRGPVLLMDEQRLA